MSDENKLRSRTVPDLSGRIINNWTVIEFAEYRKISNKDIPYYKCVCKCGYIKIVHGYHLYYGHSKQCRKCSTNDMRKFNDEYKYCPRCEEYLLHKEFGVENGNNSPLKKRGYCLICETAGRHNLYKHEYLEILNSQDNKCGVKGCDKKPSIIDHDHDCCSGKRSCGKCVRGILCVGHNIGMGNLGDNIEGLLSAAEYLKKYYYRNKNLLWEIFVPKCNKKGEQYDLSHHYIWDERVRAISGGLTILVPAKGQWIDPDTEDLYIERMIPVRIMCSADQMSAIALMTKTYYDQISVFYCLISSEVYIV